MSLMLLVVVVSMSSICIQSSEVLYEENEEYPDEDGDSTGEGITDGYEEDDDLSASYKSDRNTYQHTGYDEEEKKSTRKVFVPVYVPEKIKKKMKILSVDKGFYINGGTQLAGKFKSLKHCMKACAVTPSCFAGDFNPWLHKCYQHTNFTACSKQSSHPQYVHFSKVPCSVTDAPQGHVTLGASSIGGIEIKGVDSLSQCIKKCTNAGLGVQPSVKTGIAIMRQSCFAIDYDFATHKCFFFGSNYAVATLTSALAVHCPITGTVFPTSLNAIQNPNVIHITFCPTIIP